MGLNAKQSSEMNNEEIQELVGLYEEGYPGAGMNYEAIKSNQNNSDDETYALSVNTNQGERYVAAGRIEFSYDDMDAQISDLVVHPNLRGKGLAKTLFDITNKRAKNRGNGRVYTWASADTPAIQHIAAENGYIPSGTELETVDMNGDPSRDILMVEPDTLQGRTDTLFATDSTFDAVNSFLDGTEIEDSVDRKVEQTGSENVEHGYLVSVERGTKGSISYGIGDITEERSMEQGDVFRKIGTGTIEDALKDVPYDVPVKVAVNINDQDSAPATETLSEQGYTPTAIHFDNPLTTETTGNVHDQLLLEDTDGTYALNTSEEVGDWLENVEVPARPEK